MGPIAPLALLFLKLGTLAFGGPAAHIAMMPQEVVERRKWLSEVEFLDLLGASNLIPGPSSTELAIHIGFRQGGWLGLLLAGTCFILPAAVLVTLIAWLYQRYHALPQVEGILYGVKPVVVAIVLHALRSLAAASLRTLPMIAIVIAGVVMSASGMHQLLILVICGLAVVLLRLSQPVTRSAFLALPGSVVTAVSSSGLAVPFSLWGLFFIFAKIGAIVFGSGYVLLAFLQSDFVQNLHWLTNKQLLDAVAVGQITPGPVFTTATFIGYLLAGVPGAIAATIGIFLPGFILVALSGPLVKRIRSSPIAGAFLDGVTAASIALIAWVLFLLARAALIDPVSIGIAFAGFVLLTRFRANAAWLVIAGGVIGILSRR